MSWRCPGQVRLQRRAIRQPQAGNLPVVANLDRGERRAEPHLAAAGDDVVHHRRAEALRLAAVEECGLRAVRLVDEAIHRGEHHRHRHAVRVHEVEGLCHRDEDLLVDRLRHAVLVHKLLDAQLVLRVDERLALEQHRQQAGHHPHLVEEREHLCVAQDGRRHVERRGHTVWEVERGKFAGQLRHGKRHAVRLPLQPVLDAELLEEVHHIWVRAKKDVQTRLDHVAVGVLPRGHLAAEHVARLEDERRVAGVGEVLGAREARQTAADDGHLFALLRRRGVRKLGGERRCLAEVLRELDPRRSGRPRSTSGGGDAQER
mmetsp:Transcript_11931/g.38087  ORF Transcript_11931/g.38087 Transcript_11931/m.38087 type:complete len:317 (-) Transcript_11931:64-1014(-)